MRHLTKRELRFANSALAILTLALTAFFWHAPFVLLLLLAATGAGQLYLNRGRVSPAVYFGAFVGGPLAEAVMIYSGAWSYAEPHVLGFPLWLPFLWGSAAVLIASWQQASND